MTLNTFEMSTYTGRQCVFPFGYQGKTYNGCTIADAPDNKKWCSVQVDSDGNHIGGRGLWGHCGGDCKTDLDGNSGSSPPICTPIYCQWAGWRNWGTCSKTCCETGRTQRQEKSYRILLVQARSIFEPVHYFDRHGSVKYDML